MVDPTRRSAPPRRRRRSWVLLGLIAVAVAVAPLSTAAPVERLAHFQNHRPANIAHGGAQGNAPANTLEAYEMALDMGADTLELDAQLTADGEVVTHHDGTVDAQTDGSGAIAGMRLAELRELDAGYRFEGPRGSFPYRGQGVRIATLDEVLAAYPDTFVIIELKTDGGPGIVEAVAERIRAAGAQDRVVVGSFSLDYLRRFRALMPDVATNMPEDESRAFFTRHLFGLDRWWTPPGGFLQVPEYHEGLRVVTPGFVAAAERRGIDVQVWTVNEPDDMRRMLAMGVHGIITDYPNRLADVIAEREAGRARADRRGLSTARWLQQRLDVLTPVMRAITWLGDEEFYLLVFPLLYWSVSRYWGVALGILLLTSSALNHALKLVLRTPRPSFIDPVLAQVHETSLGLPSGHAQQGVAVWGLLAVEARRRWVRIAAIVLIVAVGYSRVHLGVHFVEDVLLGWLVGGLLLLVFLRLRGPAAAWLSRRSPRGQIWVVFGASTLLLVLGIVARVAFRTWQPPVDWVGIEAATWPVGLSEVVSPAAALFGFGTGLVVLHRHGGFDSGGPARQRIARCAVGLVGVLLLWRGLGAVFPSGEDVIALAYRYLRYALVGAWVAAWAPLLFVRLGLASRQRDRASVVRPPAPVG